jgi:uncharacterized RDD family membrane protein YckC
MNSLTSGTRVGAMFLDHAAMTFIVMIFVAPGMIYDMSQTFGNPDAQPKILLGNYYMNICAFSLYFNKDIYLGRSIAKRVFRLQIVDIKTNKPANPLRCLVRNLTLVLWPIEVVAALINNERRIGDFIAGTKLTPYDPAQHAGRVNWALLIAAIVGSMFFTYLTMFYPFELLLKDSGLVMH